MPPLGELLAGRPDGPVRAVLGALRRPGPSIRHARPTSPAARTSASSSTGTSCSCSTTSVPARAAAPRSRRYPPTTSTPASGSTAWPRSCRGSSRSSRPTSSSPLIELGEELSGRRYGEDFASDRALRILADHAPRDDVPDGRRGRALQRGPRLRAAPGHAPGDPAGPRARARARLPEPLRRPREGGDGRRLSGTDRARPRRPTCGSRPRRRGSGARSPRAPRRLHEEIERDPLAAGARPSPPRTCSCSTTPTASHRR